MGAICSGPEPLSIKQQAKKFSQDIKHAEQQRRYEEQVYEATHDSHGKKLVSHRKANDPYDPYNHPQKTARSQLSSPRTPRRKEPDFGRTKSGGSDNESPPRTARSNQSHNSNASRTSRRPSVDQTSEEQFRSIKSKPRGADPGVDENQFKSVKGKRDDFKSSRRPSIDPEEDGLKSHRSNNSRSPSSPRNRDRDRSPEFGRARSQDVGSPLSRVSDSPAGFGRTRSNPVDDDQFSSTKSRGGQKDHHQKYDIAADFASHKAERRNHHRRDDVTTTVKSTPARKLVEPPKRRNSATLLQGSFTEHHDHGDHHQHHHHGHHHHGHHHHGHHHHGHHHHGHDHHGHHQHTDHNGKKKLTRRSSSFRAQDLPAYKVQDEDFGGKDGLLSSIGFDVSFRKMGIRDTHGPHGHGTKKDDLDWLRSAPQVQKKGYSNDELRKVDKQLAGMAANFKSL